MASSNSPKDATMVCTTDDLLPFDIPVSNIIEHEDAPPSLAMTTSDYWRPGAQLKIKFMSEGHEKLKERIKYYATQWTKAANISLNFVESGFTEIRISLDTEAGCVSRVGRRCLRIPQDKETMNLPLDDYATEEEIARATLHEFGHALGCIHEHQSPSSTLNFDEEKLYAYYWDQHKWGKDKVKQNILDRLPPDGVEHSPFDRKSIMLYPYPSHVFVQGRPTPLNSELSNGDKEFIGRIYPFRTRSTGSYIFTLERHQVMEFEPAYSKPPLIALGISHGHVVTGTRPVLFLDSERVTEKEFVLSTFGWGDADVRSAGASWIEVDADNHDLQVGGVLRRGKVHSLGGTQTIYFPHPFPEPPRVIAWISGLGFPHMASIDISVEAENITTSSFDLLTEDDSSELTYSSYDRAFPSSRSVFVTWIACRHDDVSISLGEVQFDNLADGGKAQAKNGGRAFFEPQCSFTTAPGVYLAISWLRASHRQDLRFATTATDVTKEGFSWNFDSWNDSAIRAGAASWIAFASKVGGQAKTRDFEQPEELKSSAVRQVQEEAERKRGEEKLAFIGGHQLAKQLAVRHIFKW